MPGEHAHDLDEPRRRSQQPARLRVGRADQAVQSDRSRGDRAVVRIVHDTPCLDAVEGAPCDIDSFSRRIRRRRLLATSWPLTRDLRVQARLRRRPVRGPGCSIKMNCRSVNTTEGQPTRADKRLAPSA